MILFDKLWQTMQERGITQYDLYTKYNMNRAQLHRLRHNQNIETNTLVDQIINNWLHFTKRLLVKFHRAYKSNDRLLDLHLLHQNIYKFCLQVPALY